VTSHFGDPDVEAALETLGIRRLVFAIHNASFPCDSDEDLGTGSPGTRAAARLFARVRALGFTAIQLGPSGETSRDNASPYDGTVFSRALASIPGGAFDDGRAFGGLVDGAALDGARSTGHGGDHCDHRRAHDTAHALVSAAHAAFAAGARADLADPLARFVAEHDSWLGRDALCSALRAVHRTGPDDWPEPDASLYRDDAPDRRARRAVLARAHALPIERYAFGQLIAHTEHARVRATARDLGLDLFADLQVGLSDGDRWSLASAFLTDYVMGAPPSRTNPEGQPWNYPVLDPAQIPGRALDLVRARLAKVFAEHDGVRIDHPHGLVCPWVYRADGEAAAVTRVQGGARLYESPDLPDHPGLARYAIARPEQLDRDAVRHADGWVRELTPTQVDRYAVLFDEVVAAAVRAGRTRDDLTCEVLSTMPYPLGRVLARHRLGRWRVGQKANLDDPRDVYRSENAEPADWVMLGNHDTPPIFGLIASWPPERHAAWCAHLTSRLALSPDDAARLAARDRPGFLAAAMLAELLASRAHNVMVFFADLFGYEERFNTPGTYHDGNWSLRLPHDFDALYRDRLAACRALDLRLACALALAARGEHARAATLRS